MAGYTSDIITSLKRGPITLEPYNPAPLHLSVVVGPLRVRCELKDYGPHLDSLLIKVKKVVDKMGVVDAFIHRSV